MEKIEPKRDCNVSLTRLDSKRKLKINVLAQLMDIPSATVVQIAIDRLFQSKTTKERILNNGK